MTHDRKLLILIALHLLWDKNIINEDQTRECIVRALHRKPMIDTRAFLLANIWTEVRYIIGMKPESEPVASWET